VAVGIKLLSDREFDDIENEEGKIEKKKLKKKRYNFG
jgi:hypothetical protein